MTMEAPSIVTEVDDQVERLAPLIEEALRWADGVDCVVAAHLSAALARLDTVRRHHRPGVLLKGEKPLLQ